MYINSNNVTLSLSGSTNNWSVTGSAGGVRNGTSKNDVIHSIRNDLLYGGAGDDIYYLWDTGSKVFEKAGQGIDTIDVRYWGTIVLPDHVENVLLTGVGSGLGATGATGNRLDNILRAGNAGATLDGAGGNDVLVGGKGADVFSVRAGYGSDVIYNFQHGWDAVKLTGYGFTNFQQVLSGASQIGSDTRIKLNSTETLTLRDVSLSALTAADFNFLDPVAAKVPVNKTMDKAAQAWNANGWFVLNNTWGSTDMTAGKDYTLTSQFNTADMTGGTTFNWSYPLTTTNTRVLAYPEVIFGVSPYNAAGNPSDTARVFPVQVADLKSLTADFDLSYSGNLGGFNVAFDIWLANSATGTGESVVTNEIMIWLHEGGFGAYGDPVGTYTNGDFKATIYHKGTYTALVADKDWTQGTVDVADVIAKLKDLGIVSDTEYLRSVELGAEVGSGTGSLTINDLQLNVETRVDGGTKSFLVDGTGTTVDVVTDAPVMAPAEPAPSLVEDLLNSNGHVIGTVTTEWPSAEKTVVTKHDLAGNLLGSDVTVVGKEKVVQHFDEHFVLTSADKIITNADGSVQTNYFDGKWAFVGAERVTVNGSETKTQYFDAAWKPSGMDVLVNEGNGSTMLKHYNASWQFIGAERVTVGGDVTTTRTWDSSWNLLSQEKLLVQADGSKRVEQYDGSLKLTGYEIIKVLDGVEVTSQFSAQNALLGTEKMMLGGLPLIAEPVQSSAATALASDEGSFAFTAAAAPHVASTATAGTLGTVESISVAGIHASTTQVQTIKLLPEDDAGTMVSHLNMYEHHVDTAHLHLV